MIYNFVDILSHAKTDLKMIKELANNEKSYRDLTATWFKNSPLFTFLTSFLAYTIMYFVFGFGGGMLTN